MECGTKTENHRKRSHSEGFSKTKEALTESEPLELISFMTVQVQFPPQVEQTADRAVAIKTGSTFGPS